MNIPSHYNRLMPYLIVQDAATFIELVKTVFDATVQIIVPRSENMIMHAELRIGDSVIMLADPTGEIIARPSGIYIYVENLDETYKKALDAGATATMAPSQQPYGYTCGLRDLFGNDWWPVQAPE